MSYSRLGNTCLPLTCALTSNEKFISPLDSVYLKQYTIMQKYPGHDGSFGNFNTDDDGLIRTYHGKDTYPSNYVKETENSFDNNFNKVIKNNVVNIGSGCQSCSTKN
jgi:hypothetical protein